MVRRTVLSLPRGYHRMFLRDHAGGLAGRRVTRSVSVSIGAMRTRVAGTLGRVQGFLNARCRCLFWISQRVGSKVVLLLFHRVGPWCSTDHPRWHGPYSLFIRGRRQDRRHRRQVRVSVVKNPRHSRLFRGRVPGGVTSREDRSYRRRRVKRCRQLRGRVGVQLRQVGGGDKGGDRCPVRGCLANGGCHKVASHRPLCCRAVGDP